MGELLTIVVPTYNVEKYLERCLLSLVYDEKILEKLDIVIVNDGSKDNSLEIAKRFQKKFPSTITVINKVNGGHGSTINSGLSIAKGKYFRVLDSDDWVNIADFGNYVKALSKADADMVLTDYTRELIYEGSASRFRYAKVKHGKLYDLNTFDQALFGEEYIFMHTLTIKTKCLLESNLKMSEHTFYVDMEYIILPLISASTFMYLDYDIYHYWIGRPQQSMSAKSMFKNRLHHEKVLKRLVDFYESAKISKNKKKYIFHILVLMLNTHYMIYSNNKRSASISNEIRSLDRWIKQTDMHLYRSVANRFPLISYFRKTNFVFTTERLQQISLLMSKIENRKTNKVYA